MPTSPLRRRHGTGALTWTDGLDPESSKVALYPFLLCLSRHQPTSSSPSGGRSMPPEGTSDGSSLGGLEIIQSRIPHVLTGDLDSGSCLPPACHLHLAPDRTGTAPPPAFIKAQPNSPGLYTTHSPDNIHLATCKRPIRNPTPTTTRYTHREKSIDQPPGNLPIASSHHITATAEDRPEPRLKDPATLLTAYPSWEDSIRTRATQTRS
jgi:hypothetical protein